MNRKFTNWLLVGLSALLLAAAGCASGEKGDTGSAGTNGAVGLPGAPGSNGTSQVQDSFTLTVTRASIGSDGKPVVTFTIRDQDNLSYAGLTLGSTTSANVRGGLAQLVAASAGNSSYWYDYFLTKQAKTNSSPGFWGGGVTARTVPQNTTEGTTAFPAGSLSYDGATGTYTYTFATDITHSANVPLPTGLSNSPVTPTLVAYDASKTHRATLEVGPLTDANGNTVFVDGTYDFIPATGTAATPSQSRAVVDDATCNQCHAKLDLHGGRRTTVNYCPVCHNPNNVDANSGHILDLKVMTHKIHMGGMLPSKVEDNSAGQPSTVSGTDYIIWGYGDVPSNFSYGSFPMMTASHTNALGNEVYVGGVKQTGTNTTATRGGNYFPDCTKCHVTPSASPPAQATNWLNFPTKEACVACHDNIVYATPSASAPLAGINSPLMAGSVPLQRLHAGILAEADNTACAGCHGVGGSYPIDQAHNWPMLVRTQAARWTLGVDSVTYVNTTGVLAVTFHVADSVAGNVDIRNSTAAAEWKTANKGALTMVVGWPANEHINTFDDVAGANSGTSKGSPVYVTAASALTATIIGSSSTGNVVAPTLSGGGTCPGPTCTFVVTFPAALPFNQVTADGNSIAVALYGAAGGNIASGIGRNASYQSVPVKAAVSYFDVDPLVNVTPGTTVLAPTTTSSKMRRVIVDVDNKCQDCHGNNVTGLTPATGVATRATIPSGLVLHGSRAGQTALCVMCHNPNNTDVVAGARNGAIAGTVQAATMSVAVTTGLATDGLREQWVDFKFMIHGLHAGGQATPNGSFTFPAGMFPTGTTAGFTGFRTAGINVSGTDFSFVNFPNRLNNCAACHVAAGDTSSSKDSFALPINSAAKPTTVVSLQPYDASTNKIGPQNAWEASRHNFGLAAMVTPCIVSSTYPCTVSTTTVTQEAVTNNAIFTFQAQYCTSFTTVPVCQSVQNLQNYTNSTASPTGIPLRIVVAPGGGGATLPTGLSVGTDYYVVGSNTGAGTFYLSTSPGGSAVTISTAGSTGTASTTPFTLVPRDLGNSSLQYNITPTAAACSGCHDSTTATTIVGNSSAKAHMIMSGGAVINTNRAFPLAIDGIGGAFNMTDTQYTTAQTQFWAAGSKPARFVMRPAPSRMSRRCTWAPSRKTRDGGWTVGQ